MKLMRYTPTNWLDVVVMRVEGAASSWVNVVLQDISAGRRPVFCTWAQFKEAMVQQFEAVTEVEEAVSLVGKSTGMLGTTSGGFAPQTAGVGQMKLEAPP